MNKTVNRRRMKQCLLFDIVQNHQKYLLYKQKSRKNISLSIYIYMTASTCQRLWGRMKSFLYGVYSIFVLLWAWPTFSYGISFLLWWIIVTFTGADITQGSPFSVNYNSDYQFSTFAIMPLLFIVSIWLGNYVVISNNQTQRCESSYRLIQGEIACQSDIISVFLDVNSPLPEGIRGMITQYFTNQLCRLPSEIYYYLTEMFDIEIDEIEDISSPWENNERRKRLTEIKTWFADSHRLIAKLQKHNISPQFVNSLYLSIEKIRSSLNAIEEAFRSSLPRRQYYILQLSTFFVYSVGIPLAWSHYGYLWGTLSSAACILIIVGSMEASTTTKSSNAFKRMHMDARSTCQLLARKKIATKDVLDFFMVIDHPTKQYSGDGNGSGDRSPMIDENDSGSCSNDSSDEGGTISRSNMNNTVAVFARNNNGHNSGSGGNRDGKRIDGKRIDKNDYVINAIQEDGDGDDSSLLYYGDNNDARNATVDTF